MEELRSFLLYAATHAPIAAPLVFILIRAVAIIIPPIPGLVIDLAGIATFGWLQAFIYAEVGIMTGAMTAFFLARSVRAGVLERLRILREVTQWQRRIPTDMQVWALIVLRLLTNPAFDYISYAAGLTEMTATRFALGTFLGNIPSMFVLFYFGGLAVTRGLLLTAVYFIILVLLFVFWHWACRTSKRDEPTL